MKKSIFLIVFLLIGCVYHFDYQYKNTRDFWVKNGVKVTDIDYIYCDKYAEKNFQIQKAYYIKIGRKFLMAQYLIMK
ncbi:hypothetical protein [Necropsobacter massiliensis]|uniref:hypothetical protein n=1 Tax=Necropsobacter massiliensis TaxID=1400001 RepID=UPI000595B30F|nr:hypothetical protein [Necropsobacter massiliensis]